MTAHLDCDINIIKHWGVFYSKSFQVTINNDFKNLPNCNLNWSQLSLELLIKNLNDLKQEINHHILQNYPIVKDQCIQKLNVHNLIFFNLLWEKNLITSSTEYAFESILGIFNNITFGSLFYLNFINIMNWYEFSIHSLLLHTDPTHLIQIVNFFKNEIETLQNWNICFSTIIISPVLISSILNPFSIELDQELDNLMNCYLSKVLTKPVHQLDSLKTCLIIYKIFFENFVTLCIYNLADELNMVEKVDLKTFIVQDLNLKLVNLKFSKTKVNKCFLIIEKLTCSLLNWYSKSEKKDLIMLFKSETIIDQCLISILDMIQVWHLLMEQTVNYESFELLSEELKNILDDYSELIDSKKDDSIQFNQFILQFIESQKPGFRFLFYAFVKYSDDQTIEKILLSIKPNGLLDPRIVDVLCSKIQSFPSSPSYQKLCSFLKTILKTNFSLETIHYYFKFHICKFHLSRIGFVDEIKLRNLLNHICTTDDMFQSTAKEILVNLFFDPLAILNCIFNESISNNHGLIPFAAKLFCSTLIPLCSFIIDSFFEKTLFLAMIIDKLHSCDQDNQIKGITELIKKVFFYYHFKKIDLAEPRILTLESLLKSILQNEFYVNPQTFSNSIVIINLIKSLSEIEKKPWNDTSQEPAPILCHLLFFINYCSFDAEKKEKIIALLNHIMKEKIHRKLYLSEIVWISKKLDKNLVHLTYLEPILNCSIEQIFNLNGIKSREIIILASICSHSKWIVDRTHKISVFKIKSELTVILKFLTKQEWLNLFNFLQISWPQNYIIRLFCDLILGESDDSVNHTYMISCLLNIVKVCILSKYKNQHHKRNGKQISNKEFNIDDTESKKKIENNTNSKKVIKNDVQDLKENIKNFRIVFNETNEIKLCQNLFIEDENTECIEIFRSLSWILYSTKHSSKDKQNLKSILIEIAKLLKQKELRNEINETFFKSDLKFHPLAMNILQTIFNFE